MLEMQPEVELYEISDCYSSNLGSDFVLELYIHSWESSYPPTQSYSLIKSVSPSIY